MVPITTMPLLFRPCNKRHRHPKLANTVQIKAARQHRPVAHLVNEFCRNELAVVHGLVCVRNRCKPGGTAAQEGALQTPSTRTLTLARIRGKRHRPACTYHDACTERMSQRAHSRRSSKQVPLKDAPRAGKGAGRGAQVEQAVAVGQHDLVGVDEQHFLVVGEVPARERANQETHDKQAAIHSQGIPLGETDVLPGSVHITLLERLELDAGRGQVRNVHHAIEHDQQSTPSLS